MGLFNHSADASVESIVRHVEIFPGDAAIQHHSEVYEPNLYPTDQPKQRYVFALDRGVKGRVRRVQGERLGWVDLTIGPEHAQSDVIAEVSVPVKVGMVALERETVAVHAADMLTDETLPSQDAFLMTIIGRAVQIAANGRQVNN